MHSFDIPWAFNNTVFQSAYAHAYLSTIVNLHPGNEATPEWPVWSSGHREMLFNKTDTDDPVIRTFVTETALLQRCE